MTAPNPQTRNISLIGPMKRTPEHSEALSYGHLPLLAEMESGFTKWFSMRGLLPYVMAAVVLTLLMGKWMVKITLIKIYGIMFTKYRMSKKIDIQRYFYQYFL